MFRPLSRVSKLDSDNNCSHSAAIQSLACVLTELTKPRRFESQLHDTLLRHEAVLDQLCSRLENLPVTQKALSDTLGDFRRVTIEKGNNHTVRDGSNNTWLSASRNTTGSCLQASDMHPTNSASIQKSQRYPTCLQKCRCICHNVRGGLIPGFGALIIHGLSFPSRKPSCNLRSYKDRFQLSIKVTYCLPAWIANRMISMWYSSSALHGPEFQIRVPRRLAPGNPVITALYQGDLQSLRQSVAQGHGSPHDVDEFGRSLLGVGATLTIMIMLVLC